MRPATLSTIFVLSAQAALADAGGHLHPHGGEVWLAVLGAAGGLAALVVWIRK